MNRGDDRRERYAAALHEVEAQCRHDASSFACHELADAAMAVADAEQRKLATNVTDLVAAVFRAHRENSRLYAAIERVRIALDDTTGTHADAVERAYEALNGENNV